MPKRRSDADFRRFLDQYPKIRISRFRTTDVVDPAKRYAPIPRLVTVIVRRRLTPRCLAGYPKPHLST
jgi:hypothetical protein